MKVPRMHPIQQELFLMTQLLAQQRLFIDIITDILVEAQLATRDELFNTFEKRYAELNKKIADDSEAAQKKMEEEMEVHRKAAIEELMNKMEPKGNA